MAGKGNCTSLGKTLSKALSNVELENILQNEKGFRGVFPKDILPKRIKKSESGVINLDNMSGSGTHWTCYYNSPHSNNIEYFDSFGFPPPEEVKLYLKSSGKDIIYNSNQLQDPLSVRCGYYCIHYIKERNKNKSPYDVLYSFTQEPSNYNESSVIKW